MTPPGSVPTDYVPVFDWTPPRRRKVSLVSFLAASLVLHGLCFYLFQILYPPPVALLPPPARVNLITGTSEEGRVLLRWLEAEDPALSSMTQRPPEKERLELPQPKHIPSYDSRQPELRHLPPHQPDLSVPSSRPPGPVPIARATPPVQADPVSTTIGFSEAETLGPAQMPPLSFSASTQDPPQAAQFRLAVGPDGVVRHCFLERSSGDSVLDRQARQFLLHSRFPSIEIRKSKIENALVWTIAVVHWGSDLAHPGASPSPSPAP